MPPRTPACAGPWSASPTEASPPPRRCPRAPGAGRTAGSGGGHVRSRSCRSNFHRSGTSSSLGEPLRVLVTGGAGYVGLCVVEELVAAGHDARVLDVLLHGQDRLAAGL